MARELDPERHIEEFEPMQPGLHLPRLVLKDVRVTVLTHAKRALTRLTDLAPWGGSGGRG